MREMRAGSARVTVPSVPSSGRDYRLVAIEDEDERR